MVRKVLAEFDAVDGPFLQKLSRIDRGIASFERNALTGFGRIEKGVSGLLSSASRLAVIGTAIGAGFGARMATSFLDQATRIHNALRGIGADSEENFNKLFLASVRAAAGMEPFVDVVRRFQAVLGEKQGLDTTIRQVETLSKLLATSGKSIEERMSVLRQFSQALQKGTLNSDELTSLRENAPVELLRAIAKEAGGTLESLLALSSGGKLTADVLIRALDGLAVSADASMKKVTLSVEDSATILADGALKAGEKFDKGLGLTRTTSEGLQELGKVLGENADAFEMFGKAVQVAGGLLGTAYLGRRAQEATAALQRVFAAQTAGVKAVYSDAVALQSGEAATVAAREKAVVSIRAKILALTAEGAVQSKIAGAQRSLIAAENGLTLARGRFTAATNAATIAQERLSITSRAVVAAGGLLRGAWAFLGGWPGIFLAVGTGLALLASNAESASERFNRLTTNTGEAQAAADALQQTQEKLNEAYTSGGDASDEAHRRIIANTLQELAAKRVLLNLENERLINEQAERRAEIEGKNSQRAAMQGSIDAFQARIDELRKEGDLGGIVQNEDEIENLRRQLDPLTDQVAELSATWVLVGQEIARNNDQLSVTGAIISQSLAPAKQMAKDLVDNLSGAAGAAQAIASASMADPIGSAATAAKGLYSWLLGALGVLNSMRATVDLQGQPALRGPAGSTEPTPAGMVTSPRPSPRPVEIDMGDGTFGTAGGGGGGGGKSQASKDREDALRFIEEMMTAQERQAQKVREMVALRERLIRTYGPEAEVVGELDEAIQKAQGELGGLSDGMEKFWSTLSDHISQSMDEWKGWGDFVRGVLADLVSKWGPDFFEALFTPGRQSGGGFGQGLGNLVTGQGDGQQKSKGLGNLTSDLAAKALDVGKMAALSLKAPELGRLAMAGGDTIEVTQHFDLRGADPSMKPWIVDQLAKVKKQIPGDVIKTLQAARKARLRT